MPVHCCDVIDDESAYQLCYCVCTHNLTRMPNSPRLQNKGAHRSREEGGVPAMWPSICVTRRIELGRVQHGFPHRDGRNEQMLKVCIPKPFDPFLGTINTQETASCPTLGLASARSYLLLLAERFQVHLCACSGWDLCLG